MPTVIVTAPSVEPVSLAEAKANMRVDISDDDTLITALIVAARQRAETITRRSLCTQVWKMVMDAFPAPGANIGSANWYGPQWGTTPGPMTTLRPDGKTGFEIVLDHCPIVSVDSITYTDTTGTPQTLSPSAYFVDTVTEPSRIVPAYGTTWPSTLNQINSVTVQYTAGYGVAAAVPQQIKNWILLRVGSLYENREDFVSGRSVVVVEMPYVDEMLQDYRVLAY